MLYPVYDKNGNIKAYVCEKIDDLTRDAFNPDDEEDENACT